MTGQPRKNTIEIATPVTTVKVSQATDQLVTPTVHSKQSSFTETSRLLSQKPHRRAEQRRLSK